MPLLPVTLEGSGVRLEPLSLDHLPGLTAIGLEPALWRWTVSQIRAPEDLRRYVNHALAERARGVALPFATVWRATGQVIGSTRYGSITPEHRRLEIGWTWLALPFQRTAANTEAKLLMLAHAFGPMGMLRVEFKTSALNTPSLTALRRLGAVEEGTLRQHMVNEDGTSRDSVYFSILRDEWPAVRARLEARLLRG
jgi:RimJ/RimL family protein N-acetyltransferase